MSRLACAALLLLAGCKPQLPGSITTFTAAPPAIADGDTVTLTWVTANEKSCRIDPDLGAVAASGSMDVTPSVTTTYVLNCGDTTGRALVNVSPRVKVTRFSADPAATLVDGVVTLDWDTSGAKSCTLDPGGLEVKTKGPLQQVVTADTTFTLKCTGQNGPAIATAAVTAATVTTLPAPANLQLSGGDGTLTLTWDQPQGSANVYLAQAPGITRAGIGALAGGVVLRHAKSPFVVSGLVNGRAYWARVAAASGAVESDLSNEAQGAPADGPAADDPLYAEQWHLANTGQGGAKPGEDLRAEGAWAVTRGEGVRVAIVDEGVDWTHADLWQNAATQQSWDYLGNAPVRLAEHGTCVAGLVAARDHDGVGVRGVAPRAAWASYNVLQTTRAADEYDAMTRGKDVTGASNNSWGEANDGTGQLTRAEPLWMMGVEEGATTGRGGKGVVYLWAAGNGADSPYVDDSNYDGQANNRFVLAVGGVGDDGRWAPYAEQGANVLVAGPTQGAGTHAITTTDITGTAGYNTGSTNDLTDLDYTRTFNGTSAATPMVTGTVALVLSVRPELTWRDVRRVLAYSARKNDPLDPGWTTNGAGLHVNHKYGFGVIDAAAAVALAAAFTPGAPDLAFSPPPASPATPIPDLGAAVTSSIDVAGSGIAKLDFVEITVTITHPRTADLNIVLTKEGGASDLLHRQHECQPDKTTHVEQCSAIDGYTFGSVRHLDEPGDGRWTLSVVDLRSGNTGTLDSWKLALHGRP